MSRAIPGLHHVTAIASDAQRNVDFYTGSLGQRLVKRTVNFDAPDTYHLYYGDAAGTPGTLITFFPFADAGPGHAGAGAPLAIAYAVAPGQLAPLMRRLAEAAVEFEAPSHRLGEPMIGLADPDSMRVEFVETADAVAGAFHSVTLWLDDPEPTARFLRDVFGYARAGVEEAGEEQAGGLHRLRLRAPGNARGGIVDLVHRAGAPAARSGAGSIHHVAFRAETPEIQRAWRARVTEAGLSVTPVVDRQYFDAIYFREPGGVLFEIATDPPGFATDEPPEALGTALMLPQRYEARRAEIERRLPVLRLPSG